MPDLSLGEERLSNIYPKPPLTQLQAFPLGSRKRSQKDISLPLLLRESFWPKWVSPQPPLFQAKEKCPQLLLRWLHFAIFIALLWMLSNSLIPSLILHVQLFILEELLSGWSEVILRPLLLQTNYNPLPRYTPIPRKITTLLSIHWGTSPRYPESKASGKICPVNNLPWTRMSFSPCTDKIKNCLLWSL